jgi:cytoskeletal protein RodZ
VSIGEVLADGRHRTGLTVNQVSTRAGIGEQIVTAIEADDYSACGGDFYARGYIRGIAAVVGADAEPLIREYDSARVGWRALAEDATEPITPIRTPQRPRPAEPVAPVAPVGRRQRRSPAWAAALGAALVAGLGVAGYFLAGTGRGAAPSAGEHRVAHSHVSQVRHASSAPPAATGGSPVSPARSVASPAVAQPRTLTPASVTAFGSAGGPGDNSALAPLAMDGSPATAWHTDWYATATFGNLYSGTGLLADMGRPVTITGARITLGPLHGASFQLRVGTAPALASLPLVAHAADAGGVVHLQLARPARGRYVLIWFTSLPPDPAGTFQARVYDLRLEGRA